MRGQKAYFFNMTIFLMLLLVTFFIIPFSLISKTSININDTTINRGAISQIPIYGSFSETNTGNIEIIIEFNALILDIKSVTGNDNFILQCQNPETNIDMEDITKAILTIRCNKVQQMENGVFCILNIEGLAGPDSISHISPIRIINNGTVLTDTVMKAGLIIVPGTPVYQDYPESIGNNYPNPFYETTRFPISIHKPTNVKFNIYSTDGRFILSNRTTNEMLNLSLFKNKNEIPISNLNQKLERGNYILKLSPDNMRFASGEYYLVMITNMGVYTKSFIYFK